MDGIYLGLAILIFLVLIIGSIWMYFNEKKIVTQGHCGVPWTSFDVDSQGGIGLKCPKCGEYGIWASWYTKGIAPRAQRVDAGVLK